MKQEIHDSASSWTGHTLAQVEGAWGAPSDATSNANWTTWQEVSPTGGWIVRFHTDAHERIDTHEVTSWGTMPDDIVPSTAPSS